MSLRMTLTSFVVLSLAIGLVGCGGSSSSTLPGATTTPVHYRIAWATRSRTVQAPASALSATLTLTGASAQGGNLIASVDRLADPAGYTADYTTTTQARTGTYPMTIQFYDQAGGAGNVVAQGNATVTITANGQGIGDVAVDRRISSVEIPAGQVAPLSVETQLVFTARDAENAIVAVSPGSATWNLPHGQTEISLTPDGIATGLSIGSAEVRVTVDGRKSPAATVTVPAPPDFQDPGFETLSLEANAWASNESVVGLPWSGNSNWGVARLSGAWGMAGHGSTQQYAFIQATKGETEVTSHGALKQTISGLSIGQRYRVSVWIARRNGNVGANNGALIDILVDGNSILAAPTSPNGNTAWREVLSNSFVATKTSHEFTIQSVVPQFPEDTATLVDDVHLQLAP